MLDVPFPNLLILLQIHSLVLLRISFNFPWVILLGIFSSLIILKFEKWQGNKFEMFTPIENGEEAKKNVWEIPFSF